MKILVCLVNKRFIIKVFVPNSFLASSNLFFCRFYFLGNISSQEKNKTQKKYTEILRKDQIYLKS
jgi:hypothetical protein